MSEVTQLQPIYPPGSITYYAVRDGDALPAGGTVTPDPLTTPQVVESSSAAGNLGQSTCSGLLAVAALADAVNCVYTPFGLVGLATWQWDLAVVGESGGLTPGDLYYVSDTESGMLTNTAPVTVGHFVTPVGIALSPTLMVLNPGYPAVVP